MKIRTLFSFIFLLISVITLSAQSSNLDILYLKDGKRVKGIIQDYVPNSYVEIIVDGELLRYKAKEVKRIINNKNTTSNNQNLRVSGEPMNTPSYSSMNETIDEVHLNNGDVVRGSITDIERRKFVEIEVDGKKIRYEQEDIRRILHSVPVSETEKETVKIKEKEPKVIIDPATLIDKGNYNTTYLSFSYGQNQEGDFSIGPGVHTVWGKQWSATKGLGFGLGIDNYRASRGETIYPIYADYRLYPIKKDKGYYLNMGAGYGFAFKNKSRGIVNANGGLYAAPSIGYRSASKDGVSLNMELGFKYQHAYFEEISDRTEGDIEMRTNEYQRITFRLGLMFWSRKKGK
jgi:hypothetical protein